MGYVTESMTLDLYSKESFEDITFVTYCLRPELLVAGVSATSNSGWKEYNSYL